jgi:hypothetical protein
MKYLAAFLKGMFLFLVAVVIAPFLAIIEIVLYLSQFF